MRFGTSDSALAMACTSPSFAGERRKCVRESILVITGGDEYGGAEKHLIDLVQSFARLGIRTSIVCVRKNVFTGRLDQIDLRGGWIRELPIKTPWEWYRLFRTVRPDAAIFVRCWLTCLPWYTCLIALLAGIRRRVSIVHLPPTPPPCAVGRSVVNVRARLWRMRKRMALRRIALCCSKTICVSNAIRKALVSDFYFPANRTITVHNGVALGRGPSRESREAVRARLRLSSADFVLVCVARLSRQKGVDVLLSALNQVLRGGVAVKCIIVGDGPLRRVLVEHTRALGLLGDVFFEGFRADVQQYLAAADAFVLASRNEGLPLSILEAMASALPCLVTNVGGNAEIVSSGVDGLVVPPEAPDALADGIRHLATHPEERRRMSAMARTKIREQFDIRKSMANITDIILK